MKDTSKEEEGGGWRTARSRLLATFKDKYR